MEAVKWMLVQYKKGLPVCEIYQLYQNSHQKMKQQQLILALTLFVVCSTNGAHLKNVGKDLMDEGIRSDFMVDEQQEETPVGELHDSWRDANKQKDRK